MGVLNVTPDSFSDGGLHLDPERAVEHALEMIAQGADLVDVGGESTRPGAEPVSAKEELRRVLPVLEPLVAAGVPISVDTYKPEVAQECLELGVHMINDITGLRNPKMAEVIAQYQAAVCIMHMQGTPQTMQRNPQYVDVVREVGAFLREQAAFAERTGVDREAIVVDPGIGFGKTLEHNLALLRHLRTFTEFGYPVLVGPSRKSFIGRILGNVPPDQRLEGTAASVAVAIAHGANLIRVHDVAFMAKVARVADAIVHG
ncbi:MAG: dihydropteroate synthase [Candidatus Poribacteria bacterium]|nr:MAG: dihydropteroate synthase [Candidatus Poribacteria bacterium]